MNFRILVLGGYGNFGARISRRIAAWRDVELIVAGRDGARASAFAAELVRPATCRGIALDLDAADFTHVLATLAPDLVIHTAGPFQRQDYRVAQAALACGAHYVDLADGREFVAGFAAAMDATARTADRLAVTGASSVPGLSAAVLDALRPAFAQIDALEIGISPGNRTERGYATVRAILGYVGRSFRVWRGGAWRETRGWSTLRRVRYPAPVGPRWLSDCEVPDHDLFPPRYGICDRLDFHAGLELRSLHFGLWIGAGLRRIGLVRDWSRLARPLFAIAERLKHLGSDAGAMHVDVVGRDPDGRRLHRRWTLVARDGSGPEIPCTAAVLIADRLRRGQLAQRGARPCLDFFTLDDFMAELAAWPIDSRCDDLTR
jgi:hypothetical protein